MQKHKATVGVERLTSFSKTAESCLFICEVVMDWKDKEQVKEYYRKWQRENREKVREATRKWYKKNKARKHALSMKWHKDHPWVIAYNCAKYRCSNPKLHNYYRYGGRGIQFKITREECKKLWFRDKAWKLKLPSIDRIDNSGNYSYVNCRFIEQTENNRRRRKEWSIFICPICNKKFTDYPSRDRAVCSRSCFSTYKTKDKNNENKS